MGHGRGGQAGVKILLCHPIEFFDRGRAALGWPAQRRAKAGFMSAARWRDEIGVINSRSARLHAGGRAMWRHYRAAYFALMSEGPG